MINGALDLASHIAKMSPVAVTGTKHNLNYARDHPVDESLKYMVRFFSSSVVLQRNLMLNHWSQTYISGPVVRSPFNLNGG